MAEVAALITVDKFVRKLLFKKRKGNEEYLRYLTIICDGINKLNFNYVGTVKEVDLDVKYNLGAYIEYPEDCVDYITLSVKGSDNRKWKFTRDDDMYDGGKVDSYIPGWSYGRRGGYNYCTFKPDERMRKIFLEGNIPDKIRLTYISTNIEVAATNYIPVYLEIVLEKYLDWELSMNDPVAYLTDRDMRRRDFYDALREVKKFKAPGINDIRDALSKTISQSIRR